MNTVLENREIRSIFSQLFSPLPYELVTYIVDLAEKWHLTLSLSMPQASPPLSVTQTAQRTGGDHILLTSPPLIRQSISQLRKITFAMTSRDQGWSSTLAGQGTYSNSWTWFGAVVLPAQDQHPPAEAAPQAVGQYLYHGLPPRRQLLQYNRHAGTEMESYKVELQGRATR
ncbi:hypothetical protein MMC17_008255 [Xylographa soralifera]|nr:hypothetical protein [Xylographa soralifera]